MYEYELKGYGEQPLAEEHIILDCEANKLRQYELTIPNDTNREVVYTVWTDLQNPSGEPEIRVKPNSSAKYVFGVTPLLGGVYTASITFED